MAQQTAVEWLIKELGIVDDSLLFPKVEQAKEMEKEQNKDAWVDGNGTQRCITSKEEDECFDDYYEITYGK
jgi:hypothetical protein